MDSAKEFMRIVDTYGIRLVLAGHVHGDSVVIYKGKTYFITTTTTCGSVRETDYRGFRIITVSKDGTVEIKAPEGKNPLHEFASFNIEKSSITYAVSPDETAYTIVADIKPGFEFELDTITLYFYVNKSAENYAVYGDYESYEIKEYGPNYYVAVVERKFEEGEWRVTVASFKDEEAPTASIVMWMPRKPVSGKDSITVYVKASDTGWGIDYVRVVYETETLTMEVPAYPTGEDMYQATIPPLKTKEVKIKAVAYDLAGNKVESEVKTITYTVPTPPPQQPPPQQPQQPPPQQPQQPQPQPPQPPPSPPIEVPEVQAPTVPSTLILAIIAVAVIVALVVVIIVVKKK